MNLNNISLPPQLIVDLYEHALVEDTETTAPRLSPVPSLGKGAKGILIIVNKPDFPFLPDDELAFLTKVLAACQLGLAEVAIVNWSKVPHQNTDAVLVQFDAKTILLFDVAPAFFGLPPNLTPYTIFASGNRSFVAAPALNEIEKTKETKGQLWTVLKQLFGI